MVIEQTEPKEPKTQQYKGWFIVFFGGLFYMYQFMVRVSPGVMNDALMETFMIDAAALGALIGVYYWSYAMMQIPLGVAVDRVGPKYLLSGAAFLCGFACYLFVLTSNPMVARVARFLMGLGSACGLIGTIKLGTIWLEPKHIAKVTGFAILMGTFGAGLGGTPLKWMLNRYGIVHTMNLLAIIGCVIGLIILVGVQVHPKVNHQNDRPDIYKNTHPLSDLISIIRNPQSWIVAIYGMLMYIPITIIGTAWGTSFVERACNIEEIVAASVVSMMFLGAAMGSPIISLVSDGIKSRKWPMAIGSVITTSLWCIILLIDSMPLKLMYVLFFCAGFAYTTKSLTFATICETMPRKISGTAIAFVNMVVMTAGIIFHPLVGRLLDKRWEMMGGQVVENIPYYTEADYRYALLVIPVCLAISLILSFFLKESHPEASIVTEYGTVIDTDVL